MIVRDVEHNILASFSHCKLLPSYKQAQRERTEKLILSQSEGSGDVGLMFKLVPHEFSGCTYSEYATFAVVA